MREWYPERIVFKEHKLEVSPLHTLHIEECGNPEGQPVVWCHGGPGFGFNAVHARMFDPQFFRIIMFDQRGAGRSTPHAATDENTTQHLIADMEKIREHIGVERWAVAGRSWGTTLSLLYAQAHPERTQALFLAAVFLCDQKASQWLFQEGASNVYPEAWAPFRDLVSSQKRHDMFAAYMEMMFGEDQDLALRAVKTWSTWEGNTCSVLPDPALIDDFSDPHGALAIARLECHYLGQGGFIEDGQILRDAHKIAHIPTKIVHGRYDMNCTFDNALRLHQALPKSELVCVPLGGHAANDPVTIDAQVCAADGLKHLLC